MLNANPEPKMTLLSRKKVTTRNNVVGTIKKILRTLAVITLSRETAKRNKDSEVEQKT